MVACKKHDEPVQLQNKTAGEYPESQLTGQVLLSAAAQWQSKEQ